MTMAVLPSADRLRTAAQWMRDQAEAAPFSKADLRAAVNAVDDWCEANAASYNSALPSAFRSTASATQKSLLLAYVVMRRAGRLRAEED